MADINGRRVLELVKKPGNSVCADCNCDGESCLLSQNIFEVVIIPLFKSYSN